MGTPVRRAFWSEWDGARFLAVGAQDPVLGVPAMDRLRRIAAASGKSFVVSRVGLGSVMSVGPRSVEL
jgi:hypothetical protein